MIAIFGLTGWLIAQERTRAVLAIQVLMNGVNIVLDLWFVLGLDWGVTGVARATVIAEWGGLALGFWFCRDAFAVPAWRDWPRVFDPVRLRVMLAVNTDILLRSLMLQVIFISFLFLGADFGDVTLAANQVLLQFLQITAHALDGFAFAAEALVGQAYGARTASSLRRGAVMTSIWGLVVCGLLAIGFAGSGARSSTSWPRPPRCSSRRAPILATWSPPPFWGSPHGCWTGCSSAPPARATCAT